MQLLKEIIRQDGLDLNGRTSYREAVRAIIQRGDLYLLVYSSKRGDYKFPGGGVDAGETHTVALARELREECGARLASVGPAFGKVVEYDRAQRDGYEIFKMTSFYYWCSVEKAFEPQHLEAYEQELGFQPVWVALDDALRANRALSVSGYRGEYRWVTRETFVLEQIKQRGRHDPQF